MESCPYHYHWLAEVVWGNLILVFIEQKTDLHSLVVINGIEVDSIRSLLRKNMLTKNEKISLMNEFIPKMCSLLGSLESSIIEP